jgi:hypothetical protein
MWLDNKRWKARTATSIPGSMKQMISELFSQPDTSDEHWHGTSCNFHFSNIRNLGDCSAHCFHPRKSALVVALPRLQSTTNLLPSRVVRTITSLSEQKVAPKPDYEHFFRCTSGGWLWDEEQQLRDRYKAFNMLSSKASQPKLFN